MHLVTVSYVFLSKADSFDICQRRLQIQNKLSPRNYLSNNGSSSLISKPPTISISPLPLQTNIVKRKPI